MPFLPRNFVVPARIDTEQFLMRSITVHDAFKDYDAVMSSREHLWGRFSAVWGWPAEDMTIEQNIVDLGWHQKEFTLRSSFDYALMTRDESRPLGCVYIDPPSEDGTDAEVWFWARTSERNGDIYGGVPTPLAVNGLAFFHRQHQWDSTYPQPYGRA